MSMIDKPERPGRLPGSLGQSGPERRELRRVSLLLPATIYYGREEASCVIDTVSPSGVGLICELSIDVGALFSLRIDRYGVFPAEVVWRQDNRLGAKFLDTPERMSRLLGLGHSQEIGANPTPEPGS